MEKYSQEQISAALTELNKEDGQSWSIKDSKLHKQFQFTDFVSAFGFMTQVGMLAERANHHPEWSNCYNVVTIDLITHHVNGISHKDFALASKISKMDAYQAIP